MAYAVLLTCLMLSQTLAHATENSISARDVTADCKTKPSYTALGAAIADPGQFCYYWSRSDVPILSSPFPAISVAQINEACACYNPSNVQCNSGVATYLKSNVVDAVSFCSWFG